MINFILKIIDLIPHRTRFGFSLVDELKVIYFQKIGRKKDKCLCGGKIITHFYQHSEDEVSWETTCNRCEFLYGED